MTHACRRSTMTVLLWSAVVAGLSNPVDRAIAQEDPAAQPAREAMEAVVIQVQGSVKSAPIGTKSTDKSGWTDVNANDRLSAGTQIKTGFRSYANLRFGDDTVVQVKKMTLASIDDFYRSQTEQSVRLGLGYGVIRGGSAEGELRSDVVVDSTVATLAKRGTEGWQMEVEPSTAHFRISLSRSGLVEALAKLTGKSKSVRPGEYANQNNIFSLWINQAAFDREVKFYSDESQSETEVSFGSKNNTGTGVLSPGSGRESSTNGKKNDPSFVGSLLDTTPDGGTGVSVPTFVNRGEGDFGVPDTFRELFSGFPTFKRVRPMQRISRTEAHRVGKSRAPRRR